MTIAIGIFFVMYIAAMIFMGGGFLRVQQVFDLLNDNAYLITIGCALTIVMIGGGINISVGGVIGLTVMSCALFLNGSAPQNAWGIILTFLLALGIGLVFGSGMGFPDQLPGYPALHRYAGRYVPVQGLDNDAVCEPGEGDK